ncbi:hypothetical protein SAMN05444278_10319 [Psychroflexus salarius]|uniref:Uncharacterized protein n=1 Tax=Psychroflexus salarius TaxID=1155689 RepID=A0A1M4UMU7_9FLAO|nr:hypothetical protein SAMN05444278_10319 [Psychroflexus salarius]
MYKLLIQCLHHYKKHTLNLKQFYYYIVVDNAVRTTLVANSQ